MKIASTLISILVAVLSFQGLALGQVKFPKEKIKIGPETIFVEVARTPEQLSQGLMFRTKMAPNEGMLFIFPDQDIRSFWMKNTFLALSIGFFDKQKILVDIQDMQPVKSEMESSPPSYQSRKPAQYALEMNQGWFKKNSINIGDHFEFVTVPKKAAKKD